MTTRRRSRDAAPAGGSADLFTLGAPSPVAPDRRLASAAPGESAASAVSVSSLAQTIKDVLEGAFPPIWVRGEVSDFKQHRNGHWYFSLRDKGASLRCVVWSRDVQRMIAAPDEGMAVVALGEVTVYAARGELQFTVRTLDAVGDGLWRKAFERTRAALERDGLLDAARKRALPFFPRRIAIITSADGAALHDIVSVVRRRNPLVELILIPAAVQGDTAPASLCAALDRLATWGGADLVIIGRGGGSREDLWAFNHEAVARRVAKMTMPVISAVGHEVDVSICDLVADWRAPTPSAAAERAVPELRDLQREVAGLGRRLRDGGSIPLRNARRALHQAARHTVRSATRITERRRDGVQGVAGRLHALSPLATMSRGYVVAVDVDGLLVTSARELQLNDALVVRFCDGRAGTRVEQIDLTPDAMGGEP